MILIEYIEGNEYFTLNNKKYPQIYQAVAMGSTDIAIYSIHDIKNRLQGNIHYSQVKVNGVQYASQDELITVLIPILYQRGASSSSGTGTGGDTTDWSAQIALKEDKFNKNTAFNKNFGTSAGTVAQGNDSRFAQGSTAFGWGNHNNSIKLVKISEQDLPAEYTITDIAAYLTANGLSISGNEIVSIEVVENVIIVAITIEITLPTEGQEIPSTNIDTEFNLLNINNLDIITPTESENLPDGDFDITFELI